MSDDFKPHLFLKGVHTSQGFTTPKQVVIPPRPFPVRDRIEHGKSILFSLRDIWDNHIVDNLERIENKLPVRNGEYITFTGAPHESLQLESLDANGSKLLNVRFDDVNSIQIATVYIPEDKQEKLKSKVENYLTKQNKDNKPENQPLIDKIETIHKTTIQNLWSSEFGFIPKENAIWCELWIVNDNKNIETLFTELKNICNLFNIEITDKCIEFPERLIFVVKVNFQNLSDLIESVEYIAEIRKSEELNSFWFNQSLIEREDWIELALENITLKTSNNFITILDSGVNNGHILLKDALNDEDKLTANPNWGINDVGYNSHGTRMAGVAFYGNLNSFLEKNEPVNINFKLESMKILPPGGIGNDENNSPYVIADAINTAIANNPLYKRIFCMAVTSKNQNEFGKPSTWSAILDKIIFGEDNNDKKLVVISAGNVREEDDWKNYPTSNQNLPIESPAQSWNAISIGAYTNKTLPNAVTVANQFELSPFSRTSSSWDNIWPIKPDVVFEGGNLVKLENGSIDTNENLDLLTTSTNASTNTFSTINATSAATALASNFLAKLRDAYPNAWEETLRALIIHSASWTDEMVKQFDFDIKKSTEVIKLLRIVGYGVPNLQKAIECKSNYLTFISEQIIKPYKIEDGTIKTDEIHYYKFPWPKDILQDLGATQTTLRVTLSYFIEPNPGEKGYSTKYAYQSTALRFSLINPNEDFENFKIRTNKINQNILKEDLGKQKLEAGDFEKNAGTDRWALGADNVFKGSIHSNYMTKNAVDIANCNVLAIFPQSLGWWKHLKKQNKYNSELRYSLIVSIETPENTTDIYTEIANQVAVENLIVI
jgi:hypothetical protein